MLARPTRPGSGVISPGTFKARRRPAAGAGQGQTSSRPSFQHSLRGLPAGFFLADGAFVVVWALVTSVGVAATALAGVLAVGTGVTSGAAAAATASGRVMGVTATAATLLLLGSGVSAGAAGFSTTGVGCTAGAGAGAGAGADVGATDGGAMTGCAGGVACWTAGCVAAGGKRWGDGQSQNGVGKGMFCGSVWGGNGGKNCGGKVQTPGCIRYGLAGKKNTCGQPLGGVCDQAEEENTVEIITAAARARLRIKNISSPFIRIMCNQLQNGRLGAQCGNNFGHDAGTILQGNPQHVQFQVEISEYDPVFKPRQHTLYDARQAFDFMCRSSFQTRRQHHEINIGMAFAIAFGGQFP